VTNITGLNVHLIYDVFLQSLVIFNTSMSEKRPARVLKQCSGDG